MVYKYDLESLDLESCSDVMMMPIPAQALPAILGTLEALAWRARHVSDASHDNGVILYHILQEVILVNECIIDALNTISDKLDVLSCICSGLTNQSSDDYVQTWTNIYQSVSDDARVDVTGEPVAIVNQGAEPLGFDPERCQRSQCVFDDIFGIVTTLVNLFVGGSAVTLPTLVYLAAEVIVVPLPITILSAAILGLAAVVFDVGMQDELSLWENVRQTVVCEIYQRATMKSARNYITTKIDDTVSEPLRSLLKLFYNEPFMDLVYQNSANVDDKDEGACIDCVSYEFDEAYSGTPCATADLTGGVCNDDIITLSVGNPIQTPEFELPAGSSYNVKMHVWAKAFEDRATGQIKCTLYRTSSPPGATQVKYLTIEQYQNETDINTFTSQTAGTYYVKFEEYVGCIAHLVAVSLAFIEL
jgi:hypothetical protein